MAQRLNRLATPGLLVLLTGLAAVAVDAQSRSWTVSRELPPAAVLDHFPLQVGNRWIYATTHLTGDEQRPDTNEFTWQIEIVKHVPTAEGLVVIRSARVLDLRRGRADDSVVEARPYLVTEGRVYEFHAGQFNEATRQFDPTVAAELRNGDQLPSFFFPMRPGLLWAERTREERDLADWTSRAQSPDTFYHWQVAATDSKGHCGCFTIPRGAFDLLFFAIGGPTEVVFQDGVGVIGTWNRHQGTYWEETTTLTRFVPALPATVQ